MADAVALGEADETWPKIVADAERGHNVIIKAQVPLAEMLTYANDLIQRRKGAPRIRWSSHTTTMCPTNLQKKSSRHTRPLTANSSSKRKPSLFSFVVFHKRGSRQKVRARRLRRTGGHVSPVTYFAIKVLNFLTTSA